MRQLYQDLIYGARLLRKSPGFAAVAILSLAIGIGANSAMFSFADALILRPIPVPRSNELVSVNTTSKSMRFGQLSWRDYADYRDSAKTVTGLVAYQISSFGLSITRDQLPQLVYGMLVSKNFFDALNVSPALGRGFRPEEDSPAATANPAVIVSHGFWKERMSAEKNVLGRRIRLNGYEFTIVGVAPESFTGMDQFFQPALYIPLHAASLAMPNAPANILDDRGYRSWTVIGRLTSGASVEAARAEFTAIATRLAQTYLKTNENQSVLVESEVKARLQRDPIDATLAMMLVGIAGLVLVIACANVANLMLARGVARNREIAIRLSIGAGRGRLIRQLLTEALFLSAISGAAGLVVAYWAIRALALIKLPTDMPLVIAVHLDQRVLLVSLAATIATGILFGLMPAIRSSRTDVILSLRGATVAAPKKRRWVSLRDALVVAQVSVALAVLSAAGLLINSFLASQKLNVGFRTDGILLMSFDPSLIRMDRVQGANFYKELTERIRALPGVESATLSRHIPLGFSGSYDGVVIDGYEMAKDQTNVQVETDTVGVDYFRTLHVPIVRGRVFDERDKNGTLRSVIINETMAGKFWPNRDALGARVRLGNRSGDPATVVGIAKDATYRVTYETPHPHMYFPFEQDYHDRMTLFVLAKGRSDPAAMAAEVRNEVRSLNPDVPIFEVRSFGQFCDERVLMAPRVISQIVSALGGIGLTLAVIGLYGVIAYTVSRRTRELGIRMAIGAERGQIARLVLKQGLRLALTGVAIGLPLAYGLSPMVSQLMVDRTRRAEPILAGVSLMLIAVSVVAAWIPARRAARIDPIVALRYE